MRLFSLTSRLCQGIGSSPAAGIPLPNDNTHTPHEPTPYTQREVETSRETNGKRTTNERAIRRLELAVDPSGTLSREPLRKTSTSEGKTSNGASDHKGGLAREADEPTSGRAGDRTDNRMSERATARASKPPNAEDHETTGTPTIGYGMLPRNLSRQYPERIRTSTTPCGWS